MSIAFIAVKNAVYPHLKAYHDDLMVSDKEILERYSEENRVFFHASRSTGTDLFIPSITTCTRELRVAVPFLLNTSNDRFIVGRTNSGEIEKCSRDRFINRLRGSLDSLADTFALSDLNGLHVKLYQSEVDQFLNAQRKQYLDRFLSFTY